MSSIQRVREWLAGFLFPAESDEWLAVLRVGLGLQVASYTLSSRGDWLELFARRGGGLVNRELTEAILSLQSPLIPRLGWLVFIGSHFGLSEPIILWSAWTCLLCAGFCLLLGFFCRPAAVIAWFLHLCAVKSEDLLSYGMDNFTTIGLFYLMLSPLPDHFALDAHIRRFRPKNPHLLGFFLRVLQLHVCVIYFFGGITKCMGIGWWNGNSIWRALTSPPYNLVSPDVLITCKYLLPFLGIFICTVETGYPFFIWPKETRLIWLTCIIGMHIVIGLTMGLYLFSLITIILNLAAFGPRWFLARPSQFALKKATGDKANESDC
ncbi:MAG TPA: HTTM domain-containing protein [Candidatus Udaeobacter sp.]|jgi:hypothetical protein|nr:HTTM domain-containing protein [Candidatus Udaeobacter sp.]